MYCKVTFYCRQIFILQRLKLLLRRSLLAPIAGVIKVHSSFPTKEGKEWMHSIILLPFLDCAQNKVSV